MWWANGGCPQLSPWTRNDEGGGRCSSCGPLAPFIVNVTKYRLFLSSLSVGKSIACVHGPLPNCNVMGFDGSTFRRHLDKSCRMSGKNRRRSLMGFGIWWWFNLYFGTNHTKKKKKTPTDLFIGWLFGIHLVLKLLNTQELLFNFEKYYWYLLTIIKCQSWRFYNNMYIWSNRSKYTFF